MSSTNAATTEPRRRGNPTNARIGRLRACALNVVTEDDVRAVVSSLVDRAKAGDNEAAQVFIRGFMAPARLR